jgi:peptide/nickel transport system permease protein
MPPENYGTAQILKQATQSMRRKEFANARRLASLAVSLDPTIELPWLILAATASPHASIFYLNKALELNPNSETAQMGMQWAVRRLDRLKQVTTAPTDIALPAESADEITRPIAIPRKPQNKLQQLTGWVKRSFTSRSRNSSGTFQRVAKYTGVRVFILSLTIIVSLYLIINIANLGGYMDTIQKGLIRETITGMIMGGWLKDKPLDQRQPIIDQTIKSMEDFYGLNQPYLLRSLDWLYRGITFDWGKSIYSYPIASKYWGNMQTQDVVSNDIRTIIATYLPRTLLLLGTANLGFFLVSILIALPLVRKPHTKINRLVRLLSLTSSIPSWVFGLILFTFFIFVIKDFSFSLGFNGWPTTFRLDFIPIILKALFLPFLAIFLSKFFQSVYAWRTYFLIYSKEDYIELAKAKGLPDRVLEQRYLLRPALPAILTSFALIMVSIWQECIAVEYFFNVGGIGSLFIRALNSNDLMIVFALVATFAFLLAITVLVLDVAYAIVDPRIRIGTEKQSVKPLSQKFGFNFSNLFQHDKQQVSRSTHFSSHHYYAESVPVEKNQSFAERLKSTGQRIVGWGRSLGDPARSMMQDRTAVVGVVIILILMCIAIVTVITIPYNKAISLWRGDDKAWIRNPKEVPPEWTNIFRKEKLPVNIDLNSRDPSIKKVVTNVSGETTRLSISLPFEYNYNTSPQDILVLFNGKFKQKNPFVIMTWVTPDGREIPMKNFAVGIDVYDIFSADKEVVNKLGAINPIEALFIKPDSQTGEVLQGRYELKIDGFLFEKDSQLDAEMVVYGQVYGLTGTDSYRRDLSLVLAWGLVVALSFGIIAAIGTTISSVLLAAACAWFGGWVDALFQRITEIMMVLPILPISILIFYLYSKSIWVILGVTIGLGIFGNSVKNYRAMFLQVMESPYISAALAYGASSWRIIFQYMIPRIRHVLIPQLIILVPGYVFFESTLAFLGVSDPNAPTLGKLLATTMQFGIFNKPAYLTVEPFALLLLITLGFAFLGFGLEEYFNQKLGI